MFLGEAVGWRRWLAILIGLVGVIVIIRPGMEGFSVYSIWALGAVACVTLREIVTRKLSADLPSMPVALATAVAIAGLGAVMLPAVEWRPCRRRIMGRASCHLGGDHRRLPVQRDDDPHRRYRVRGAVPLYGDGWAIGLGLLMFAELPDMPTLAGTAIIVVTGLYSLHRERSVSRSGPESARPASQDPD